MKKILLSIALVLSLSLLLTACNGIFNKDTSSGDDTTSNTNTETGGEESTKHLEYVYIEETDSYQVDGIGDFREESELVIPAKYKGKPVKSISGHAFSSNQQLKSVKIAGSIEEISGNAFYGCELLEKVEIEEGVKGVHTDAFQNCISLNEIILPSSLVLIQNNAFDGCVALSSITLPENLEEIWDNAFQNCTSLTEISIPNSVKELGSHAFAGCDALKTINIGSGLSFIRCNIIDECSSIENIEVSENNEHYMSVDGVVYSKDKSVLCLYPTGKKEETFVIPEGVKEIAEGSFYIETALTSISIPNTIERMSDAIYNLTSLEYNQIDNVKYLGNEENPYVVLITVNNKNVTTFKINENTKIIAPWAFASCSYLKELTVPNGVKTIEKGAFVFCSSLKQVELPEGLLSIGELAFQDCGELENVRIPNSLTRVGMSLFANCESLSYERYDNAYYLGNETNPYALLVNAVDNSISSCNIHENTKLIGTHAFQHCEQLENIVLPDGLVYIGVCAFSGCKLLEKVEIPSSVMIIDGSAFVDCIALKEVIIQEGTTEIGESAFEGCTSIEKVVVPSSVKTIYGCAFCGCNNATIYCEAESKPIGWSYSTIYPHMDWNYSNCAVYWFSEAEPTEEGNYWHYLNGEIVKW